MNVAFELNLKVLLRWIVGLFLIWAALSKIANPQQFLGDVAAYRLPIAPIFLRAIAMGLPWLELLSGLLLLANLWRSTALTWALILFLSFTAATAQAWSRGLQISCGCMDLRIIGLDENSGLTKFLESPAVAFFRALLLSAAVIYLIVEHSRAGRFAASDLNRGEPVITT